MDKEERNKVANRLTLSLGVIVAAPVALSLLTGQLQRELSVLPGVIEFIFRSLPNLVILGIFGVLTVVACSILMYFAVWICEVIHKRIKSRKANRPL